jgi:uncharacterized protein YfkK (UPF0435 family)
MTVDERLEKLVERHEALTQTVELVAKMQLKNEELTTKNEEAIKELTTFIRRAERIWLKTSADFHARLQRLEEEE